MNDKNSTPELIDELIDSVSKIERVNTPPFFKDKVLLNIDKRQQINKVPSFLYWLTPKYQFAALLLFVFLNLSVLYYYTANNKEQELESFADAYGLSSSQEESILN